MTSPFGPLRLIVDARPGPAGVGRCLPQLQRHLQGWRLEHDVRRVRSDVEAEDAARAAVQEGITYVVAAGADHVVLGVVNGLLDPAGRPRHPDIVLGVASAGSSGDFARTYGLDRPPEVVARHLASEHCMSIDVGEVTFTDGRRTPGRRFFANAAQAGWGAEVARRTSRLPRWLGRSGRLLAAYGAIRAFAPVPATIALAHAQVQVGLVNLVVANGQFVGEGLKVAPRALPDDGAFNVLAFVGGRAQMFVLTPRLRLGEHLPDPAIAEWQSPTVRLAPEEPVPVEADGVYLGTTPATFRVIATPLRLKI